MNLRITGVLAFLSFLSLSSNAFAFPPDTTAHDSTVVKPDTAGVRNDTATSIRKDTAAAHKDSLGIITSEANLNTVPGFRVQILATQDLQEALDTKEEAESELDNLNVYLVYDPPYYKVRIGDYRIRYEANQAATYVGAHGFPNAWTVPDNVFKNPQPKK